MVVLMGPYLQLVAPLHPYIPNIKFREGDINCVQPAFLINFLGK